MFCAVGVQLMSVDEHQAGRHAGDTGPGGWAVGERAREREGDRKGGRERFYC